MPDIGVPELLIILVIIILLFGPGRIGKMGGELGKGIREFRQGLQGNGTAKAMTEKQSEPESQPEQAEIAVEKTEENPPSQD